MRPSNRHRILEAAIQVIHRDGVTGVTFDSVAAEARVTRGGMMYHFPSREALLRAIHQHLADQWEASLVANAGKPLQETTPEERAVAYALTSGQSATRSELLFLLHSSTDAESTAPWDAVSSRWAPQAPQNVDDPQALSRFIARLAADGLWVYESLSSQPLPPGLRERVLQCLASVLQAEEAPAPAPGKGRSRS